MLQKKFVVRTICPGRDFYTYHLLRGWLYSLSRALDAVKISTTVHGPCISVMNKQKGDIKVVT